MIYSSTCPTQAIYMKNSINMPKWKEKWEEMAYLDEEKKTYRGRRKGWKKEGREGADEGSDMVDKEGEEGRKKR